MPVESRDDLVKQLREPRLNLVTANFDREDAATRIECNAKRIAELETADASWRETLRKERETFLHCTRSKDEYRNRAITAERELDTANVNHRDMASRLKDMGTKLETAERALAEERERHQWRTIDSAPKDGTLIDLWMMSEHRRLANCRWSTADEPSHKGAWFCQQGDRSFNMGADDAFTHWRPHPAPPDATTIRSGKPDGKE